MPQNDREKPKRQAKTMLLLTFFKKIGFFLKKIGKKCRIIIIFSYLCAKISLNISNT